MKKKILVTGGAGYIGSHTVVELIEAGYEPIIIDNLCNSTEISLVGISKITGIKPHFEKFDLCDNAKLDDFFARNLGIVGIIHFAALKAVGESVTKPLEYYENNIVSLLNLIKAMQKYDISHLVFSSSCTVYGQPDILPVTEDSPILKAMSPYGNTKQIAEEIIADAVKANPVISATLLRYFNPIGAHKSALIGELPLGVPLNLVPFITQTAIGIRQQLNVFGSDYNTPDGTCIRDYINVVDLAKAHIKALERLIGRENTEGCEVFNIGTGNGSSVLEIIKTFESATGEKLNYQIVGRREGDIESIYAETSKANTVLNWKSTTPLSETLLSAWNWEKYIRNILKSQ